MTLSHRFRALSPPRIITSCNIPAVKRYYSLCRTKVIAWYGGRSLGEVKALVNPKHQVVVVSHNWLDHSGVRSLSSVEYPFPHDCANLCLGSIVQCLPTYTCNTTLQHVKYTSYTRSRNITLQQKDEVECSYVPDVGGIYF